MPSIQPQHRQTSSASCAVTDGSPDNFLWSWTHTSGSASWWAASHASNATSLANALMRRGSGMTGAMTDPLYPRRAGSLPIISSDGDDDLSPRVPAFDVTERVGRRGERVPPVDDGPELPGRDQIVQDHQIGVVRRGHVPAQVLAHKRREDERLEEPDQHRHAGRAGAAVQDE